MNWLRSTLTRKFLLLLFGFLMLQLLQLGIGVYDVLHIGQNNRLAATLQLALAGASLLLAVLGVRLLRASMIRPLRDVTDVARAIADGAYDRRVERHASDELGELARTLNRMAAAFGDKTDRLRALNEVALVVTSSLSLDDILGQIMLYGLPLGGAQGISIAFYDGAGRRFHNRVTRGLPEGMAADLLFPPAGMAEDVMRRDEYLICNDRPGTVYPLSPVARAEGIRSIICLPLASDRQRLGVIYFFRCDRDDFEFEEIELIQTFSRLATHAIQNAHLHATTVDLAETDVLTGLPNRRKLEQRLREELQRAQRMRHSLALLLLDVDHFKDFNDRHGHAVGDVVLKTLALVFKREVREIDLVARSGGEEFTFVLPGTDGAEALHAAERIRMAVAEEGVVLGNAERLSVTVSVGVACYPQSADSVEAVMTCADRALYAAKHAGRDRSVLYSETRPAVVGLTKKRPDRGA